MLKLVIIALILLLTVSGVCPACGPAEYLIGHQCCPMCGPGYHVRRHCTEYTSTSCVPCPSSTYTDEPSGLEACMSCTVCDSTGGLRVKRACSFTSNALCEPLEGHYCTDPIQEGCRGAGEHTKCKPGQYIKQQGTPSSDTVCGECVGDTYSNGSFTSCRPHTQCELTGLDVLKEGSPSHDTVCGRRQSNLVVIAGVIVAVVVVPAVAFWIGVLMYIQKTRRKRENGEIVFPRGLGHITTKEEQSEVHISMMAPVT